MTPAAVRTVAGDTAGQGLVLPQDSLDETSGVARAYHRYLTACCRQFVQAAPQLPAGLRPVHARIAGLVHDALQRNPRAVLRCFAAAPVATALQCLPLREELTAFTERIDAAGAAMMPHLLLDMALRGLMPNGESILWDRGAPRLASLALGGELVPPEGSTGLRFSASHIAAIADGAELARLPLERQSLRRALAEGTAGFRLERSIRRIASVSHFTTVDHNPIAAFE